MAGSGKKLAFCDSGKNSTLSLFHSSKEKLRRKRIKTCYEQLRMLLPHGKGIKNDVASILEATVDYMSYLQGRLPQDVTSQIAKTLQNKGRFSKGRRRFSKDSAPPLFSPIPRNNTESIKVLDLSREKTGSSNNKIKGSLCIAADCYPTKQTWICEHYETVQPHCYIPVLCLPVMTSLPGLPSLFYSENAEQEITTLIVNPNNVSSSDSWIQSHDESGFRKH